jgi:hypothetical protein
LCLSETLLAHAIVQKDVSARPSVVGAAKAPLRSSNTLLAPARRLPQTDRA